MALFTPLANSKNETCNFFGFLIMNIQALEQEVLHLPIEDRARLAEKLLLSLGALSEQEKRKTLARRNATFKTSICWASLLSAQPTAL